MSEANSVLAAESLRAWKERHWTRHHEEVSLLLRLILLQRYACLIFQRVLNKQLDRAFRRFIVNSIRSNSVAVNNENKQDPRV